MKIHVGDIVLITTGRDKGKKGKVLKVLPKTQEVMVEGCNVQVKHRKPMGGQSGQRLTRSVPLSVSKVALINQDNQPDRVGYVVLKDGVKLRKLRKSGQTLEIAGGETTADKKEGSKSKKLAENTAKEPSTAEKSPTTSTNSNSKSKTKAKK